MADELLFVGAIIQFTFADGASQDIQQSGIHSWDYKTKMFLIVSPLGLSLCDMRKESGNRADSLGNVFALSGGLCGIRRGMGRFSVIFCQKYELWYISVMGFFRIFIAPLVSVAATILRQADRLPMVLPRHWFAIFAAWSGILAERGQEFAQIIHRRWRTIHGSLWRRQTARTGAIFPNFAYGGVSCCGAGVGYGICKIDKNESKPKENQK